MRAIPFSGRRLPRRLARVIVRLRRERHGAAAVEFALILPLMLLIYLGTAETTQDVMASRKATVAAQTIADIVTQQAEAASGGGINNMTDATMGSIFNATAAIMQPFSTANTVLSVDVAAVSFTLFTTWPTWQSFTNKIYIPSTGTVATAANPPTTANPGYAAKVRWVASPSSVNGRTANSTSLTSSSALARTCSNTSPISTTTNPASTPLTVSTSSTAAATATTLNAGVYGSGSVIVADISYTYKPLLGADIVKYAFVTDSTSSPLTTKYTNIAAPRDTSWGSSTCTESGTTPDSWICYPAQETGNCAYN